MSEERLLKSTVFIVLRFIAFTVAGYALINITSSYGLVARFGLWLLLVPFALSLPSSFNRTLGFALKSSLDTEPRNLELYWQKPLSEITEDEVKEYRKAVFLRDLSDKPVDRALRRASLHTPFKTNTAEK